MNRMNGINMTRYILIGALLLVCVSLVVACTMPNPPSSASGYLCIDETVGPQLSTQELVAEVAPAVISIVVETVSYNWFWQAVPETGVGSGIIINSDGYIVTNNHVIEDANKVTSHSE
jgi:S1-C subfamily serine protease